MLCHFLRVLLICRVRSGSQHLVLSISTHGKGGEEVGASPLLTILGRCGSHAPYLQGGCVRPASEVAWLEIREWIGFGGVGGRHRRKDLSRRKRQTTWVFTEWGTLVLDPRSDRALVCPGHGTLTARTGQVPGKLG